VNGLSYGLGYKLKLHWTPTAAVRKVSDSNLADLNDEFFIKPFDSKKEAKQGDILGIHINLNDNPRDLYISFRGATGHDSGVIITQQDKDKPNSELVDLACHTPSMRDARMRKGWTYMDPSLQVVVVLKDVSSRGARLHLYKAPKGVGKIGAIRARPDFSDGNWKCPRTCTDSDLLVAMYGNCRKLKSDGYCGGTITMSGGKYSIQKDLCPESCGKCSEIMEGPTLKAGGCKDRNIKISGRTCRQAASAGFCEYKTNIGHVGNDLCPSSCGKCPPKPDLSAASHRGFKDPEPERTHGKEEEDTDAPSAPGDDVMAEEKADEAQEKKAEDEAEKKAEKEEKDKEQKKKKEEDHCTDDRVWTDPDGDSCEVYAKYIEDGQLSRDDACNYGGGAAKTYCRKTCRACKVTSETCEDKQCVTQWHIKDGQCHACADWPKMCSEDFFKADCPKTCEVCKSDGEATEPPPVTTLPPEPSTTTTTTTMELPTPPPICQDNECVDTWVKKFGKCYRCKDFAAEYCGKDEDFMASCPRSCNTCKSGEATCFDHFRQHTCARYVRWGWCKIAHVAENCPMSCGICPEQLKAGLRKHSDRAGGTRASSVVAIGLALFASFAALAI